MKTRVISAFDRDAERDAARVVSGGGVFVYPTETSYAIGCDATNHDAALRVFSLKKRELAKPLPVIVASKAMAQRFIELTPAAEALVNRFMPGPLTIVARKRGLVVYAGDRKSLAFRISSSTFAREVSMLCGVPVISTSANLSGDAAIYDVNKAIERFDGKVELIVAAGMLPATPASTIIDVTGSPKIVREGPVSRSLVLKTLREGARHVAKPKPRKRIARKSSRAKRR
jgi:L-threonylcarbamoyladenylate synthase